MSCRPGAASRDRRASLLLIVSCAAALSGCLDGPIDPADADPRLYNVRRQLEEAGLIAAAERAAEVFEPGAPLVGGMSLGRKHAAIGLRVVSSSGYRPDISTVKADEVCSPESRLGSSKASSHTIIVDGALRLYPGWSKGDGRYLLFGIDGLARVASVPSTALGDNPSNDPMFGYGGRLGLLTDREGRYGLSMSIMKGNVHGASYEATVTPTAPVSAAHASMSVSNIGAKATRLQGSASRGAWGISAGIGVNSGRFKLNRRATVSYGDSVLVQEGAESGGWDHSVWNLAITRRVSGAEIALQYGETAGLKNSMKTALLRDAGSRKSVSLGAQVRY